MSSKNKQFKAEAQKNAYKSKIEITGTFNQMEVVKLDQLGYSETCGSTDDVQHLAFEYPNDKYVRTACWILDKNEIGFGDYLDITTSTVFECEKCKALAIEALKQAGAYNS